MTINIGAVIADIVGRGPRDEGTRGALRPLAYRVVIRVEKITEALVELPVSGRVRRQNEGLEEPSGMRAMPLGRARLQTRLHHLIFRTERGGKPIAGSANFAVTLLERRATPVNRLGGWLDTHAVLGKASSIDLAPVWMQIGALGREHLRRGEGSPNFPSLATY